MKWLSRKLIVVALTAILTPLFFKWGLPEDVIAKILKVIATYLGGQSVVDALAAFKATTAAAAIAKSEPLPVIQAAEKGNVEKATKA